MLLTAECTLQQVQRTENLRFCDGVYVGHDSMATYAMSLKESCSPLLSQEPKHKVHSIQNGGLVVT